MYNVVYTSYIWMMERLRQNKQLGSDDVYLCIQPITGRIKNMKLIGLGQNQVNYMYIVHVPLTCVCVHK